MIRVLTVQSPAFQNNGAIPSKYSYNGANISPPLSIKGIPADARSLVLTIEDPDAVATFDHWLMWNIPVTSSIEENTSPGIVGLNSLRERQYSGPNPPSGEHHYLFKVHALDTLLEISEMSTRQDLEKAMQNHILASGTLIGIYKKPGSEGALAAGQH